MKKAIFFILIIQFNFLFSSFEGSTLVVDWSSEMGVSRLSNTFTQAHTWKLIQHFESQHRLKTCGIASAVTALNALSITAPASQYLGKYRHFTQEEFFSPSVSAIVSQKAVEERGLSLNEMEQILQQLGPKVEKYLALDLTHEEIRNLLVEALNNPHSCILAVYDRKVVNQVGGGHWSPVAAYDRESDSFLILDVARYKYPPVWIDAATFINAMQTLAGNDSRGFILLSKIN